MTEMADVGALRQAFENALKAKDSGFDVAEDVVNEPSHYKHGSFEVIDEMVLVFGIENTIQFCRMHINTHILFNINLMQ